MEEVIVKKDAERGKKLVFKVNIGKGGSATSHKVTVNKSDIGRLAPDDVTAAELVKESFRFLLEHESKESILSSFELTRIGDFFPEYEENIGRRLKR